MDPVDLPSIARDYGIAIALFVVVIMGMAYTIRTLWADNVKLREKMGDLQDKRIDDWKQQSCQLSNNIAALTKARELLEARNA